MNIFTLLIVILVVLLLFSFPSWPYASGWGYGPSGVLFFILIIVVIIMLINRTTPL